MIDPQARQIIDAVNSGPPLDVLGLEGARAQMANRPRPVTTGIAEVRDLRAGRGGIPVRLYRPEADAVLPLILFAHGGGWILGSIDSADESCRRLARASGCAVLSVGYRLAPEARHPAAVEDMLDVLAWLPFATEVLGIDAGRIAISGESSGAHVALAAALADARAPRPALRAQLLVCPPVDRRMASQSWAELGDVYVPRRSQMAWMWDLYLGAGDEYALGAPDPGRADPEGLPPTVLVVAEYDPLRDEALRLRDRLQAAGVTVRLIDCAGQIHPVFGHAAMVQQCDRYLSEAAAAIGDMLRA